MTKHQLEIIEALEQVSLKAGSQEEKFLKLVRAASKKNINHVLTDLQDKYLRDMTFRYRRQLPLGLVMQTGNNGFSTLQWMAPGMVREGLIKNEPWVPEHATKALELFPNKLLHKAATLLAALHPYAYDYIAAAPVLVLVVAGAKLSVQKERVRIAREWVSRFEAGKKLRDLMATVNIAYPLRKISAEVIRTELLETVKVLSTLSNDTLNNYIPKEPNQQRQWLELITQWHNQMSRRFNNRLLHLEWACKNYHPRNIAKYHPLEHQTLCGDAGIFADFVGHIGDRFDPEWSLQTVATECRAWHDALIKATNEQEYFLKHNMEWEQPIDYAPLPLRWSNEDYEFWALNTGKSLFDEGREMHHCVASYSRNVISGQSRIYSMMNLETGKHVATVEFSSGAGPIVGYAGAAMFRNVNGPDAPVENYRSCQIEDRRYGPSWHLSQAKGRFNEVVMAKEIAVINRFLERINYQAALWKHTKEHEEEFKMKLKREQLSTMPVYLLTAAEALERHSFLIEPLRNPQSWREYPTLGDLP